MATLLAHIRIRPGSEAAWEDTMCTLVDRTMTSETGVIRYEYWKAEQPDTYYALLSFVDKEAFLIHQDADYHRNAAYGDAIEDIRLEWVDPVAGASPLPRTENPPLPDDAPDGLKEWVQRTPVQIAPWWSGRL